MGVREITEKELQLLRKSSRDWFNLDIASRIRTTHVILVSEGKWTVTFVVSRSLYTYYKDLEAEPPPINIGTRLGLLMKNKFRFDVESIDLLGEFLTVSIILTEKGEQTALRGRNVPKSGIRTFSSNISKDQVVMLKNAKQDILGLGRSLMDLKSFKKLKPPEIAIKTILDRGWYIRKGN